ncbi:MAG: DUF3516 domain-containing protein, partial [Opitutales bacterium]|nr:DUF3516 domain-containing protein [Opitutales bacterium]
ALKLLSLVESILENPDAIWRKQLDTLKTDKMAEMKAEGIEYDERIERLDAMEYPKPESDFIYETFNAFARLHPWIGKENIKPKSIAREMFERYSNFADYIKMYGLPRMEGLLLRHLTNVYRVLENTIPPANKTEDVKEIIAYIEALLKRVDSSLIDEWELMRNPEYEVSIAEDDELLERARPVDITQGKNSFTRLVRNEVFGFVRSLADKQYQEIADTYELDALFEGALEVKWKDLELEKLMVPFYETRDWIRLDPAARSKEHTHISVSEDENSWSVEQTLVDSEDLNDWLVGFEVDLVASRENGLVEIRVIRIGMLLV